MNTQGTPKKLREAIDRAMKETDQETALAIIKDFLAQRFGTYLLLSEISHGESVTELLHELYKSVVDDGE